MRLRDLKTGESGRITVVGGQGALRQHFLDMGVVPGAEIKLMKLAPMGDPMEFRIHGYELTLRLADAEKIEIEPVNIPEEKTKAKHPGLGEGGIYHVKADGNPLPDGTTITFALAGNQNCGKTTLFNQLTGANQHVGNFPGVTVDRKDGVIKGYPKTLVTDLPGIYSMSPYTSEEIVTRQFLLDDKPKGIINIVDATNIERNLYLTMQLMELDIPMVLALNILDLGIGALTDLTDAGLTAYGINPVVHSLVIDGIFKGVGSVLAFLPIIVTLFFFLSILEDSGYMARVAFVMDKLLRKIGLSGRSIVPMLIGFGCTVPGVMASRTLPSERDRKMTILLTPFMSCSAKLPIYGFFSAAFFPEHGALVMIILYFTGILVGILFALLARGVAFRGEPVPFVMELPNYRLPGAKNVGQLLWEKAKDFLERAFTVIFVATIVIWCLQTFDTRLNVVSDSQNSLLAMLAGVIAPVFAPLGFGDWRISTALITGFMAKESVVATLTVLTDGISITSLLTPLAAAALLVFCLLYTPCVAAITSIKRELGGKWAALVVVLQCVIAWLCAFAVYIVGGILL